MQNLNELAQQIHENAKAKGFWDEPRNTGEIFMLIVSELAEALEADREGKRADMKKFAVGHDGSITDEQWLPLAFQASIKDTFEDEIADVVIRILDWCAYDKIDIEERLLKISVVDFPKNIYKNIGESLMSTTTLLSSAYIAEDDDEATALIASSVKSCFRISEENGFDLMRHIELKMKYNATRDILHGKKY